MQKLIKIIGLMLFTLLLWTGVGQTVAPDAPEVVSTIVILDDATQDPVDVLQSPVSFSHNAVAELGGVTTQVSLIEFLRVQRTHFTETFLSLKAMIQRLANRLLHLSNSRIELCASSPYYRYHPVCEYYIFTLKRILI